MEYLLEAFPLYRIHEEAAWEEPNDKLDWNFIRSRKIYGKI
jgi:hypothetical protein